MGSNLTANKIAHCCISLSTIPLGTYIEHAAYQNIYMVHVLCLKKLVWNTLPGNQSEVSLEFKEPFDERHLGKGSHSAEMDLVCYGKLLHVIGAKKGSGQLVLDIIVIEILQPDPMASLARLASDSSFKTQSWLVLDRSTHISHPH